VAAKINIIFISASAAAAKAWPIFEIKA